MAAIHHKQVKAQISDTEFVYVDEPLKSLIEILNRIEGIHTFESCQGYKSFAEIWAEGGKIFKFARYLANYLANQIKQDNLDITSPEYQLDFSIQWDANKTKPYLLIQFPNILIEETTNIFSHVQTGVTDGI